MSHVLVVEDDEAILHALQATLEFGGHSSTVARSAAEALQSIGERSFHAVLLDLGLPDLSGSHLIEKIRSISNAPVLVVSGQSGQETIVGALNAGADDFVAKPFLPGELLARVRALLRRGHRGKLECGLADRRLFKSGSAPERLFDCLRRRLGDVATTQEIISSVWEAHPGRSEANVRVLIAAVRRQLRAESEPFRILNVHGKGYRLVSDPARYKGQSHQETSRSELRR